MGRLPVRLRLTLWFTALLVAALALFAALVLVGLRERLYASFDEQLLDQAALAQATIELHNGVPALPPGAQDAEYFLRLFGADGKVVAATSQFGAVPVAADAVSAALGGETRFDLLTPSAPPPDRQDTTDQADPTGETDQPSASQTPSALRIVTLPVRSGTTTAPVGALQVGLDRDDIDEALGQLQTVMLTALPLALLLAAGGGYLMAGRALAPVAAITALATRIEGDGLHARLGLDLPDDELGRLARAFDAMLARIEGAFARQRQFTADAAHELRTPLSLMRTQIDVALAKPRSAAGYREALRGLDGDLQRLTGLVSTLLTLARADSDRLVPERAPFDAAATVGVVIEQYAPLAAAAGVTLNGDAEAAPLVADEDLLLQVLVNLVDNALAHTPPAGAITVGCRSDNGCVHLWVEDTGSGIAPTHQARVFDRFYRSDTGRARAQGGSGLGLAISRAIVEAHGGTIGLVSEVGRGTRVDLDLPASIPGAVPA